MMAAYPQQAMHPGLQQGHPGMAATSGQMVGQPMMHPGVSAAPHVTQAAMMNMQQHAGMQQGAGHPAMPMAGRGMGAQGMPGNPQVLAQLTPAQAQLMQQQQQLQGMQNPQLLAHMQQQQRQAQQRAIQNAQALGMSQNNLNPQQIQQMMVQAQQVQQAQQNQQMFPGGQGVQLPPHMLVQQQQLRQQAAQQQQVQQQAQQAQQAQQQQAQQQQAQQQQAQQQAAQQQAAQQQAAQQAAQQQQLAMQHVASQGSNSAQQNNGPQAPNTQQAPMRPQSRLATAAEQAAQQQRSQTPQQAQQTPQQGQTPQSAQQHAAQAQSQAGQAGQNQAMTSNQQVMASQQLAAMQKFRQQQQQIALQRMASQGQMGGQHLLKLMLFADQLGSFTQETGSEINRWNQFIDRHFAQEGRLVLQLVDQRSRQIEILRATLPRYFWMYFESGAKSLRLHTESGREEVQPDGRCRVLCSNAIMTVSYPNGARSELSGPLSVLFSQEMLIEGLEFQMIMHEEHIARTEVERVLSTWSPTISNAKSPKLTKKNPPKGQQKNDVLTIDSFPKAPKGQCGMSMRMYQFLEISETMALMQDLMHFSQEKALRPAEAVESIVNDPERTAASLAINQQMAQMVNGTPRMKMGMPGQGGPVFMGASPGMTNMTLPMQNGGMNGSPQFSHLVAPGIPGQMGMNSSPASNNMAPPMMPQHSHQGTNSTAASADTSPQVNNKRRRSTVKMEEDGGGGEGKVKPSPRMGKKAKPS